MALQSDDIELVAVNDPFITTDYMVNLHLSLYRRCIYINVYMRVPVHFIFSLNLFSLFCLTVLQALIVCWICMMHVDSRFRVATLIQTGSIYRSLVSFHFVLVSTGFKWCWRSFKRIQSCKSCLVVNLFNRL